MLKYIQFSISDIRYKRNTMKDRKGKIRERYDVKSVKDKCVGGEMIRRKTISIGTQFSYIRQELQS